MTIGVETQILVLGHRVSDKDTRARFRIELILPLRTEIGKASTSEDFHPIVVGFRAKRTSKGNLLAVTDDGFLL